MRADAQRQQLEREKFKARQRAQSDATEVPPSTEDILTQSFDVEIEVDGICFNVVKLFHPLKGGQRLISGLHNPDPMDQSASVPFTSPILFATT